MGNTYCPIILEVDNKILIKREVKIIKNEVYKIPDDKLFPYKNINNL